MNSKNVLDQECIRRLSKPDLGGNLKLLNELAEIYLKEMPVRIEKIRQSIEDNNFDVLENQAHKMRSGSAYLGANGVEKLAEKLEIMALEQKLNGALSSLEKLEGEFELVAKALASLVTQG